MTAVAATAEDSALLNSSLLDLTPCRYLSAWTSNSEAVIFGRGFFVSGFPVFLRTPRYSWPQRKHPTLACWLFLVEPSTAAECPHVNWKTTAANSSDEAWYSSGGSPAWTFKAKRLRNVGPSLGDRSHPRLGRIAGTSLWQRLRLLSIGGSRHPRIRGACYMKTRFTTITKVGFWLGSNQKIASFPRRRVKLER